METSFPKTGGVGTTGAAVGTTGAAPGGSATGSSYGTAGKTEAKVAGDAHNAVDRATQGAHDSVDRLAAKAAPMIDRAKNVASDVQTTLYAKFDDFRNSDDWTESARDEIRAHPLAIVGIALLAGLIIGRA